jgi:hypothetical protein
MGLTITIPAELGEKLSKRAGARGLPLEEHARGVLERHAMMPNIREVFAPVREQIEEDSMTDEELDQIRRHFSQRDYIEIRATPAHMQRVPSHLDALTLSFKMYFAPNTLAT